VARPVGLRGGLAVAVGVAVGLAACVPGNPPGVRFKYGADITTVRLSTLELHYDGAERFEECPPAGNLNQSWIPPIAGWDPSVKASVVVPADADGGIAPPDTEVSSDVVAALPPATSGEIATRALDAMQSAFRRCHQEGLALGPAQDARIAVAMRVDASGHVASVETWGVCGLTLPALRCMRDEAVQLRLPPPTEGSATLVAPIVFVGPRQRGQGLDDDYAAGAAVALERMRPRLHACMEASRRAGIGITAKGRFTLEIDRKGKGVHVAVDLWKGAKGLLGCAAEVVRDAPFPEPPSGWGEVVVTLSFDPRPGVR
jgi:hypothetical protein